MFKMNSIMAAGAVDWEFVDIDVVPETAAAGGQPGSGAAERRPGGGQGMARQGAQGRRPGKGQGPGGS